MTLLEYGFFRTAGASLPLRVADPAYNAGLIIEAVKAAEESAARLLVLPELCLTGCTCADLFRQDALIKAARAALEEILVKTRDCDVLAVVGLPAEMEGRLFNCAALIQKGSLLGLVPRQGGARHFSPPGALQASAAFFAGREVPAGTDLLFSAARGKIIVGVESGGDFPLSAGRLVRAGANIICNPSGEGEIIGSRDYRKDAARAQSALLACAYVYAGAGVYESTTDSVFGGAVIIAENGKILAEGKRFSRAAEMVVRDIDTDRLGAARAAAFTRPENAAPETFRLIGFSLTEKPDTPLLRRVNPHPFVPADPHALDERCREIFSIQTAGLAGRLEHTQCKTAVIGVSGGLDSTLALLVTAKTFDILGLPRAGITAVTMPGFGTTDRTYANAVKMIHCLGAGFHEIDIKPACIQHFKDIGHDPGLRDTIYENVQARERTHILMDMANKQGGLVIGTGDLSELALGWCTYNGDHMSMYGLNAGVPKTLVRHMVVWIARNIADGETRGVLVSVADTPISPELLPPDEAGKIKQKTEDILGPYEVHDFFLYNFIRRGFSPDKILLLAKEAFKEIPSKESPYTEQHLRAWLRLFLRRFFSQQFKRSCVPDGPSVGTVSLSPRGAWRMPSDAAARAWLARLEES